MDGAVVGAVTRFVLKGVALGFEDVEEMGRAFPNLSELVLLECVLTDTDVALISRKLGSRMLNIRLQGVRNRSSTGISFPPGFAAEASDALGSCGMVGMQVLCLDRQSCITSQTFSDIASMEICAGSMSTSPTSQMKMRRPFRALARAVRLVSAGVLEAHPSDACILADQFGAA